MLEAYVIAELSAILRDAYYEIYGKGLTAEQEREVNRMAHVLLPKLDGYFSHRLKVEEIKKEITNLKNEKDFNSGIYKELMEEITELKSEVTYKDKLLKLVVSKVDA
jgi:hypothetical protein